MRNKYGILIDKSSLVSYCLDDLGKSPYRRQNSQFFAYLSQHPLPKIGIVTSRIVDSVREHLIEKFRYKGGKKRCLQRFDQLGEFTILEKVDTTEFNQSLLSVKNFFRDIPKEPQNEDGPTFVSSRFRGLIDDLYFENTEKIFLKRAENEDKKVLAEGVYLSKEYRPLFLVSIDEHFSGDFISSEIQKAFGITSGYPHDILQKIRGYEQHLFKGKPIFNHVGCQGVW